MKPASRSLTVLFSLLSALACSAALAQAFPSKPLRIVVPFVPGGGVDMLARLVSPRMGELLGQPMLVDNRGGAGGNIGADVVAKAPPDGYTILLNSNGHALSPAIYRKLPFDTEKDFAAISQLVATTLVLVSNPKLPAATVKELITLARSKQGGLNYGSTGVGNPLHLTMELLKLSAGIEMLSVPYKGDAPLNTALMSGEIDVAFTPLSSTLQFIAGGRLRALAVAGAKRSTALPDVPTVAEGALPGFESSSWQGLFAPAKTPRDIVAAIQRAALRALEAPEMRDRIQSMAQEVVASTPDEFEAKVKSDIAKFTRIVKEARIPLQD